MLKKFGYEITQCTNTEFFVFERLLNFLRQKRGKLRFMQIGACDGISFDPIYPFLSQHPNQVEGLVIEPLPDLYEQLKVNYRHCPNVEAINTAIHNKLETLTLYRVDPTKLDQVPSSAIGITSSDPEHHLALGIKEELMQKVEVPCCSLMKLVEDKNLGDIDLLLIDTEGYDFEILKRINFSIFKPHVIRFEHNLNTTDRYEKEFEAIVPILHDQGYELFHQDSDCIAYQRHLTLNDLR